MQSARARRLVRLIALAAVMASFFVLGGWLDPLYNGPQGITNLTRRTAALYDPKISVHDPYKVPKLASGADTPRLSEPRSPEPRALAARAESIRQAAEAIRAECHRAAGGDWEKWQRDTASYRTRLLARIASLKDESHPEQMKTNASWEVLEGKDAFPLFEINSRQYLNYLYDPKTLDLFRRERPVVAADRWLRQRGIDLIFVPVPKMTEVYVEHFVDPCPPDGIIAPHVRRTLWELLTADVEVVDGLRLFRSVRDADAEYLYNTADHHWAPRGMRVMAKAIADRIERYDFGARARFAEPIVRSAPGPYRIVDLARVYGGFGRDILTPEQYERAKKAQTTTLAEVRMPNGQLVPDDPTSPVLVIGNSYVPHFREQLVKELNLLICTRASDHQTTHSFTDFVREPELLNHCRVIVWISTEQHMTQFYPLPPPVAAALSDK
jgi:hypothetical protein